MSRATRLVNTALTRAYAKSHATLLSGEPLLAGQMRLLSSIVKANVRSEFGRAHGFDSIASIEAFRAAVPLSRWDDYAAAADRIAAGQQGVLTSERVRLLEPSSGSTAATKLVPYTATLSRQFRAGIEPWLHDLYTSFPGLTATRSYWSVTPAATHPKRQSVVPIGFDDDADYLGPLAGRLINNVFAVAPDVARATSMRAFRCQTGRALLEADDLGLVSVWNPTFWLIMLEWISEHASELLPLLPDTRRRAIANAVLAGDWTAVWPRLQVISCWADANAAKPAAELAAMFPEAHLQPKGLLATEAMVSVPITAAGGPVLAARSHFFEFLPQGEDSATLLAHELTEGETYEVVVTTGGGLYRYRLGDLVEVVSHHRRLPVLRFLGRADKVSDLVGEKLSEAFVAASFAAIGIEGFAMLASEADPPHYVLYTDVPQPIIGERLDAALRESFHYDYARRVGQLANIRVVLVEGDAQARYLDACVAAGQRLGDIKPVALALRGGWDAVFA